MMVVMMVWWCDGGLMVVWWCDGGDDGVVV